MAPPDPEAPVALRSEPWSRFGAAACCWTLEAAERLIHSAGKMKFTVVAAALLLLCVVRAEEEDKKEDVGTVVGIDLGTTYSW